MARGGKGFIGLLIAAAAVIATLAFLVSAYYVSIDWIIEHKFAILTFSGIALIVLALIGFVSPSNILKRLGGRF